MKIVLTLTFLFLLAMPFSAQSVERLRQVKNTVVTQKSAPRAALSTLNSLIGYVRKAEPDMVEDTKAQEKWLTKSLRKAMMDNYEARQQYLKKNPDAPLPYYHSNEMFTGVWSEPTTYSIVSSRQYDYRDAKNPNAKRVIIDVIYVWGDEDDLSNQYPGIRNLHSFIFLYEDLAWKLEDIYIFNDEFTSADSLSQTFRNQRF